MGHKDRLKTTSTDASAERDPASGQPMRAALKSGEWEDFVGDLDQRHARDGDADFDPSNGADAEFATMFLATSPHREMRAAELGQEPDRHPSSSTAIGPFGLSTERKMRTLDPREPSVELTRLDLFSIPASSSSPAPSSVREGEPVPPSYRTRIGLYYVPRDPATEPTLPLADFGDEKTENDVAARHCVPVRPVRDRGFRAWLRKVANRLRSL